MVVVFDVVIALLEIMEFILVFGVFWFFLAGGPEVGSSLFELALSGVIESFDAALLETDDVSSFEGGALAFVVNFS